MQVAHSQIMQRIARPPPSDDNGRGRLAGLAPRGDISLWDRCREGRMLGVEAHRRTCDDSDEARHDSARRDRW